jgi:predicted nucleotidyltransferase
MQAVMPAVENLVSQIVEAVHPLRIILFGSVARGDMRPDSDIDLLIVMPEGTDSDKVSKQLYCQVGGVKVAFDMVVATPDILEKYKDNCALIYKWALKEGREVYAA